MPYQIAIRVLTLFAILVVSGCPSSSSNSTSSLGTNDKTENTFNYHVRLEFANQPKGNWPAVYGPYYNSTSLETGLNVDWKDQLPPILWKAEVGLGYNVPLIQDNRVYIHDRIKDEERIVCFDANTGSEHWKHTWTTTYKCDVDYSNGPYATPALGSKHIYAFTTESKLICLSLDDGQPVWTRDLQADYEPQHLPFPVGASPLLIGDRLYVNVGGTKGDSSIVAFNATNGQTLWTALNDGRSFASPLYAIFHGKPHLVVFTDKYLSSLNPDDGSKHWSFEFGVKKTDLRFNNVTPIMVDNRVIATAGPGPGSIAIDVQPDGSGKEAWRERRNLDSQFNNILSVDDSFYGFTSSRNSQAEYRRVSVQDGKVLWGYTSDLYRGTQLAADGKLFLLGESGDFSVLEVNNSEPKVLYESPSPILSKPSYSAPALANKKLYLRDETQLICIPLAPVTTENQSSPSPDSL